MNVVDSCGWLEFFGDGPNADYFAPAMLHSEELIVPSISIYEVFKLVAQQRGDDDAIQAVALMQQGSVVDLTTHLAIEAARVSTAHRLPMADAVMLATSRAFGATLWTQDADFAGMDGVKYVEKTT